MVAPPLALCESYLPLTKLQESKKQLLTPDVTWTEGPDYTELVERNCT